MYIMKKKRIYTIVGIIAVALLIFFLNNSGSVNLDLSNLEQQVGNSAVAPLIFVGLWIMRLIIAIPGVTLTILGGLIFSPFQAFVLSLMGLVISDSLVYLLGKSGLLKNFKQKIAKKHGDMLTLIEKFNLKFLALGVLCPVAPTDVICYLSAYLGIGYIKYIATFILANIPALLLYSYLGESVQNSPLFTLFIVLTILAIGLQSLKVWNKLKAGDYEEKVVKSE